jgi:ankyrin repeat protein
LEVHPIQQVGKPQMPLEPLHMFPPTQFSPPDIVNAAFRPPIQTPGLPCSHLPPTVTPPPPPPALIDSIIKETLNDLLLIAIHRRDTELLQILHERGANPRIRDADGMEGVQWSAFYGDITMLEFFLNATTATTKEEYASSHATEITQLTPSPTSFSTLQPTSSVDVVELKDYAHRTAFRWSLQRNHFHVASRLLKLGASLETRDRTGSTPLHALLRFAPVETIKFLLSQGADPNTSDKYGQSCFHVAVFRDKPTILSLLFKHGADPRRRNGRGETPLELARRLGKESLVCYLEQLEERWGRRRNDG